MQPPKLSREKQGEMGAYDQFIWFGDSLTQQAWNQEEGFAAGAAVQNGEFCAFFLLIHGWASSVVYEAVLYSCSLGINQNGFGLLILS